MTMPYCFRVSVSPVKIEFRAIWAVSWLVLLKEARSADSWVRDFAISAPRSAVSPMPSAMLP